MEDIPRTAFYFVRHGETDWNVQRKIMGKQDIQLNANGIEQAEESGYVLASIEIDKIFTSPLKRAYRTAEIIADSCRVELEVVEQLQERGRGDLEGKIGPSLSFLSDEGLPVNGETYEEFKDRIIIGLRKILSAQFQYPLIVSHTGVFSVLAYLLTGKKDLSCPNGKVFIFIPSAANSSWEIKPLIEEI
jgi:uncharacterized phosphatase